LITKCHINNDNKKLKETKNNITCIIGMNIFVKENKKQGTNNIIMLYESENHINDIENAIIKTEYNHEQIHGLKCVNCHKEIVNNKTRNNNDIYILHQIREAKDIDLFLQ